MKTRIFVEKKQKLIKKKNTIESSKTKIKQKTEVGLLCEKYCSAKKFYYSGHSSA